jgi:hypothetical protein
MKRLPQLINRVESLARKSIVRKFKMGFILNKRSANPAMYIQTSIPRATSL